MKEGVTTLDKVCSQITDGKHGDCLNEDNSGFFFLSCKDVINGTMNYGGARQITEEDFRDTHRRTKLEPLDILITNSGTIGRMAIVPDNDLTRRTTFQKSVAILKPIQEKVDPYFLYYLLHSELHRLMEFAGGTAQKNLLLRDLRAFPINLPDLPTQRKIAGILSAYDDLIENNLRRIRILEEMAQSFYREWFVHFRYPGHESVPLVDSPLGPIPKGWEVQKLGDLADQIRRGVPKGNLTSPTPYVGLEHIPRKSIALNEWVMVEELGSNKLQFNEGEILFGKIRPYFHKVSIAPFTGICSADTIIIRSKDPVQRAIVASCVFSEEFVAHASATANGAKMPRADWKVLKDYLLPLPPSDLLDKYSRVFNDIDYETRNLVRKNQTLKLTRDLLLPKMLSQ